MSAGVIKFACCTAEPFLRKFHWSSANSLKKIKIDLNMSELWKIVRKKKFNFNSFVGFILWIV